MIEVKTAKKRNKKCFSCGKYIGVGMKYIEFPYNYIYFVDKTRKKNKELDGIKKIFRGLVDKYSVFDEEYDTRKKVKYKRYCEDCLFWAFEKHLKGESYDTWLKKQVINEL